MCHQYVRPEISSDQDLAPISWIYSTVWLPGDSSQIQHQSTPDRVASALNSKYDKVYHAELVLRHHLLVYAVHALSEDGGR